VEMAGLEMAAAISAGVGVISAGVAISAVEVAISGEVSK